MADKQWRVLVVDDDPDIREVLQVVLKMKYGCEVIAVSDGAAAIESVCLERPDLILMDLILPIMTGFEATRQLTTQDSTSQIPVVGISDHSWEEAVHQQAIQAGCRDCINKADLFGDLHKTIHKIMQEYVPDATY